MNIITVARGVIISTSYQGQLYYKPGQSNNHYSIHGISLYLYVTSKALHGLITSQQAGLNVSRR